MPLLKPIRLTANVPAELQECINARIRELRYPSTSAYIVGLILYDLYCRRPHKMTADLMRDPQWLRDEAVKDLVRAFAAGPETKPGGWFERKIEEIVTHREKERKDAEKESPPNCPQPDVTS